MVINLLSYNPTPARLKYLNICNVYYISPFVYLRIFYQGPFSRKKKTNAHLKCEITLTAVWIVVMGAS